MEKNIEDSISTPDCDGQVAIFVPSRCADGQAIHPSEREWAGKRISALFTELFGGASVRKPHEILGTFNQEQGQLTGHLVDECILRYFSFALKSQADAHFITVRNLASEVAGKLGQESVGLEWFGTFHFVAGPRQGKIKSISFSNLPSNLQSDYAAIGLRRVSRSEDLILLLSLSGWTTPEAGTDLPPGFDCIAQRNGTRLLLAKGNPGREELRRISGRMDEGTLILKPDGATASLYRVEGSGRFTGGIRLDFPGDSMVITRRTWLIALALLESTLAPPLATLLERHELTAHFFRGYTRCSEQVRNAFEEAGIPARVSGEEARLLLGRMMVLKFLEARDILEGDKDYLRRLFTGRKGDYYLGELVPKVFEVLDTPGRIGRNRVLPYLNGGLFRRTQGWSVALPDSLFDPDVEGSALDFFRRYDFSMAPEASIEGPAPSGIDPSIFGHVLESLCSDESRKSRGVFYTPGYIARALARKGLCARLAKLTGIKERLLLAFREGKLSALSPAEAAKLRDILPTLRILDPAAGSGALLLAVLEELMGFLERIGERRDEPLKRGGAAWSEACRLFVRECLFGVDIDPGAVEVARLRFWLFIALADSVPEALPDLSYNLRAGDSLSALEASERLDELLLGFTESATRRNDFLTALKRYKNADPVAARALVRDLEDKERAFASAWLEETGRARGAPRPRGLRPKDPTPFAWHIHFAEVFDGENRGFDLVIANPPYVRAQALARAREEAGGETVDDYIERFDSMRKGARDLYLAFVERALELAGKSGQVAFVMPNFARSKAGGPLRALLGRKGALDLWVDFGDQQVFESATNYVALLFAGAGKHGRKSFEVRRPRLPDEDDGRTTDWLESADKGSCPYRETSRDGAENPASLEAVWRPLSTRERKLVERLESSGRTVGDACEDISVGVQTSADEVFLLTMVDPTSRQGLARLYSKWAEAEIEVELGALRPCAKGSTHLKPHEFVEGAWLVWPYGKDGEFLGERAFKEAYPKAYAYLKKARSRLEERAMDRSGPDWWLRYGRDQGFAVASQPKILVPALMKPATAWYDSAGRVAFTASGKGGGGAYALIPQGGAKAAMELARWLNSDEAWEWLRLEGDPKRDGWRGVDEATLRRMPYPDSALKQEQ